MLDEIKMKELQEAVNAAPVIDTNVMVNLPKKQILKETRKYKCTCCGDSWDVQKGHFNISQSVLYQSNGGYIDICNTCRDNYFAKLVELFSVWLDI